MPGHMLMTPVSVMAALKVSVGRHLLTSMKSPQITNKRAMIALYHSTAEEKAETNIPGMCKYLNIGPS
ncbi:hypothetical protein DPMN_007530 [Dreissena polymorpha]|uniref:Uncharacterized protein n=1 Tax=Dreissena polymorpha TaxID=45954 RepID=A0A9D4MWP3_DREPO|nr:hypothetical protein DPMN_007530 [Dreissena polymorpha]